MRTLLLPLLLIGAPAIAQSYPSGDAGQGQRSSAAAANNNAAAHFAARDSARAAMSADEQARYSADLSAYDQARRARRQTIRHDQAYYDRQQRAYAAAMADWRAQAAACRRGHTRACNAPAPRPGDYM